jgi:hypothetical protein
MREAGIKDRRTRGPHMRESQGPPWLRPAPVVRWPHLATVEIVRMLLGCPGTRF